MSLNQFFQNLCLYEDACFISLLKSLRWASAKPCHGTFFCFWFPAMHREVPLRTSWIMSAEMNLNYSCLSFFTFLMFLMLWKQPECIFAYIHCLSVLGWNVNSQGQETPFWNECRALQVPLSVICLLQVKSTVKTYMKNIYKHLKQNCMLSQIPPSWWGTLKILMAAFLLALFVLFFFFFFN